MAELFSVFYNSNKKRALRALAEFEKEIEELGGKVLREKISSSTDVVVAVGGDGTLLRTSRHASPWKKPVGYINAGTLGFLGSRVKSPQAFARKLFADDFVTQERMLLEARADEENFTALNDIVIKNGNRARVIELEVFVGGVLMGNIKGDGVIISTPTGSTAYSLAAGGPVLSPELDVIVVSPLNPHSLNSRSVVIPSDTLINVKCPVSPGREIILTADGQQSKKLSLPCEVSVDKNLNSLYLVKGDDDFFEILSEKMNWGSAKARVLRNSR